jgi:N-carbamoyl-L-amino-acid hydrolase
MLANLMPDFDLAARVFEALRARTHDGVGITRAAYGPGERIAHEIVLAEAATLGLDIATDHMGNRFLTLPGADRAAPWRAIRARTRARLAAGSDGCRRA